METKASELALNPYIITNQQKGDTTEVAWLRANEIRSGKFAEHSVLLIGGETTIKITACEGKGGRNQHYAAVSMIAMAQHTGEWTVASIGTDGSDFLPDVAGAIVDRESLNAVRIKGIDIESYLTRYDSNNLLDQIGNSLIITDNTGTNVGDIIVYLLS